MINQINDRIAHNVANGNNIETASAKQSDALNPSMEYVIGRKREMMKKNCGINFNGMIPPDN